MSPAIRQDVQTTNRIFEEEVVGKRNIDALDRVYTANARVLPPGGEMVTGRENIKTFWRNTLEALEVASVQLETVDFEASGETGYEIGRATLGFRNGQSAAGKYVVVWKVEDGRWKYHTDIWNLSA